ncbi:ABC transporter permease [Streptomyces sp. NBC_00083]|uniref:ABC transporter permease n=1 Tax=Streptomyces sp. NBC_00083 TaxID=2975647 RepID=UPI00224E57A2|nr:ABC transporter permease [Streptomyces sp. NBC_00083]MCX5384222.1 ABC transporter permease [Streptomyces sp. NBC_00083]
MSGRPVLRPARLGPRDILHTGAAGMRSRPLRVVLSALGIAIGIATMIAVVGISASSKEQLLRELDKLGTNMLVVTPGTDLLTGKPVPMAKDAAGRVARISGVEHVGATGSLPQTVRRSEKIPDTITGGIQVQAATDGLLTTLRGTVRSGTFLNPATGKYPSVVLGDVAARRLGITTPGQQVYIDGQYFAVLGILDPLPLAPEIARSALVGWDVAESRLGFDGRPTAVYERSADAAVDRVHDLIPRSVSPETPHDVGVSDPSSGLQAKAATEGAFSSLLLGLGGVALLVGGVGVANTMIISVLERRYEIGLRRSIGATRGQIRGQFVTESLLLSGLGGAAGIVLGGAATAVYSWSSGIPWVVPPWAVAGGFGATLVIGTVAGLYPAVRASRLSPTLALHSA